MSTKASESETVGSGDGQQRESFSLSMVVPAFNEELLIEDFVRKSAADLKHVTSDFEIVLVDDGSTDHTLEIARRLSEEIAELKIIALDSNRGTGASIIPAYRAASKEIIFNNTVDAFFDTEDLPRLIPHLSGADVLSGYRNDLRANSLYQKLLTVGNYVLIRLLFRMPLRAYQTLQFHRRDFLRRLEVEARSSFLSPELLYKARRAGMNIKEVPITFHARKKGKAKGGKPKHVWRTFRDIFRLWFRWIILGKIQVPPPIDARP